MPALLWPSGRRRPSLYFGLICFSKPPSLDSLHHPFPQKLMSFPEEPLHLPPHKGGGYFSLCGYYPAAIHQKLNGNRYEIIRKLGPQSSTWLAFDLKNTHYHSIEIFTIGASGQAERKQVPILKCLASGKPLPVQVFRGSFWEKRHNQSHLCVLTNPLSASVRVL